MADTSTNSWKLLYESGRQALQDRKLQEAEQSFSAALQLAEDFAAGDPRLVATLNALARIYSLQRRYLAAAALLNRLLEVTERTLGPSHVQVAGVLTNLAEMYTHLGAAREELELRERVLGIRGDDPTADATSLQRLRDRVVELHAILASQEPAAELDEEIEHEPLPIVRTDEYSAPITRVREPEPVMAAEPMIELELVPTPQPAIKLAPMAQPANKLPVVALDDAFRLSPASSQPSIAPWPGTAATGTTPTGARTVETSESVNYDGDPKPTYLSPVEMISVSDQPVMSFGSGMEHGFSDMGRDELRMTVARKLSGRSSIYSIAAGVVLIAGLLAARDYVKNPDAERVSAGSVSLAAAIPQRPVVTPVIPAAVTTAPVAPMPDARTVERLIADRLAQRDAQRANEQRVTPRPADTLKPEVSTPRAPNAMDIEKTLRNVDVAVKAIDLHTRAATDSATAIRVQAPTFKKVKMADQP